MNSCPSCGQTHEPACPLPQIRGARLLARTLITEESLDGGRIVLPEGVRKLITQQQAEVLAVGPGDYDEEGDFVPTDPEIKPGRWIMHAPWARKPWLDDPDVFLLDTKDVIAIFLEDA